MAAKAHDCDTIVRVAKGSYSDYIRPLESDAAGKELIVKTGYVAL